VIQEAPSCHDCPRLVDWREGIAANPPARHQGEIYWAKPVPPFGDPDAEFLIVGLAPAANGANRTGRMFTGDRSGDWLYRALHKAGVATQPQSQHRCDGLELSNVLIAAVCLCAPPNNKPTKEEMQNCKRWLAPVVLAKEWKGVLCLGSIAWENTHRILGEKPPKFGHGTVSYVGGVTLVGSYHPSQQNTFTGRLTEPMLDHAVAMWLRHPASI
jgi:uracil-DNA glycosylase